MRNYILLFTLLLTATTTAFAQMKPDSTTVDMGFGIEKKATLSTAAISTIGSDKIMQSSSLSLQNALYGKILGLTAMQSGGFDNSNDASFNIRGLQTTSSNDILVLVDGFERPLSTLTLHEVESVSVLRDAAAIALYGFKGINGVVLVKTKRGLNQQLDVKLSYDRAMMTPFRLPKMVDGFTYANALNEARANDGLSPAYNPYELSAFEGNLYPYVYPNVDWTKAALRDMGSASNYNISIRGGDPKVRYFTMLNLQGVTGLLKETDTNDQYSSQLKYSQANVRTNIDIDFTPSSKLSVNLTGIFYESNRPGNIGAGEVMGRIYQIPSSAFPLMTEDGYWGGDSRWTNQNLIANIADTGYGKDHGRSLFADMKFRQDLKIITQGLSASLRFGYDNHANYWEKRVKGFEYASDRYIFDESGNPLNVVRTSGGDKSSELTFSKSLNRQWRHSNIVASVDYEKSLGKHNMNASLMYTSENEITNEQHNTFYRQNISSYMHYDYDNRYIADLVLMYSGSNKLAFLKSQYGFSPTLSAAWVISNEEFLKGNKSINYLKIRASGGIICSDDLPELNITEQSFGGGGSFYFTDNYTSFSGTKENKLASANPKLEKAYKLNVGVDATLFNSVILSADAYCQSNRDIILAQSGFNSSVLGVGSPYVNAGIVDSRGVEIGIDYVKSFGELTLQIGGKYTLSKNKIIENLQEPVAYPYLNKRGHSISQCYGLEAIGFFRDQDEINNYPIRQNFSLVKPGDIKYKNQNNDDEINENDVVPIGYNSSVPEQYFSFDLGFEYKGFGVSVLFQGVANYSKFLTTTGLYRPMNNNVNISEHYYNNRWAPGADNSKALYPRLGVEESPNNNRNSTVWLQDMSYLKLRNCEVYYKLPVSWISKIKLTQAKIYVRGSNLFSWDHIDIVDPENTGTNYPTMRSYNFGVSLNF